jgi:hypothetical protein
LRGLRGITGLQGVRGVTGLQGAQGAPAAQTLVVRYGPVVTAAPGLSPDAIAPCASGERVFGGGFAIAGGVSIDFLVLRSIPNAVDAAANPTSWLVEFANRDYNSDGLGNVDGRAVAICGSP